MTGKDHGYSTLVVRGHLVAGKKRELGASHNQSLVRCPNIFSDDFAKRNSAERHVTAEIVDGSESVMDRRPIVRGVDIGLKSYVVTTDEQRTN
jgi:hypothetical protein